MFKPQSRSPYARNFCFDSIDDFLDACRKPRTVERDADFVRDWAGNESYATSYENARRGKLDLVPTARARAERAYKFIDLELPQWARSVYGPRVNVARFLEGNPINMERREMQPGRRDGARLFFCTDCSGTVAAETILTRGLDATGLLLGLQRVMPVELYLYYVHGNGPDASFEHPIWIQIRVETRPLHLAQLAYCISSAAFVRHLTFRFVRDQGFEVSWPSLRKIGQPTTAPHFASDDWHNSLRHCVGLEQKDFLMPILTSNVPLDVNKWFRSEMKRAGILSSSTQLTSNSSN